MAKLTAAARKMGYACTKAWRQRHPDIKAYRAEEARKWRAAHPDLWKEIKSRHRLNNLDRIRKAEAEAAMKRRKSDPEGQRRRMEKFKANRELRLIELAGRPRSDNCDICGKVDRTVFDHCHVGGHFRGWICDRCNKVLGLVYDDTDLLLKMVEYLNGQVKHSTTQEAA